MTVVIKTVYDEVLDALNMNTTSDSAYRAAAAEAETYLTENFISRLTYANRRGSESTYNAVVSGENFDFGTATPTKFQVYIPEDTRRYDYWLSPHFEVQTDVNYQLNASRSLEVTSDSDRDSRDTIVISAVPVNFALLMVDTCRILANHFSRIPTQSIGSQSISPTTVRQELMAQASWWTSENQLYG